MENFRPQIADINYYQPHKSQTQFYRLRGSPLTSYAHSATPFSVEQFLIKIIIVLSSQSPRIHGSSSQNPSSPFGQAPQATVPCAVVMTQPPHLQHSFLQQPRGNSGLNLCKIRTALVPSLPAFRFKFKMASEINLLSSTFNVRVPMVLRLSPVFASLQSAHHRIRVRLLRKALDPFKSELIQSISLLLEQARIDGPWITLTTLEAVENSGAQEHQHSIPIATMDHPNHRDYEIGSFGLKFVFSRQQNTLSLKLRRELLSFDCCKLETVKMVESSRLLAQLQLVRARPRSHETGLLSMDNRHRLIVESWDSELPIVGVWIRGPYDLNSLQVYETVSKYCKMSFDSKCSFDPEQPSFVLVMFNQEVPEAHLLSLSDSSESVNWETQTLKEEVLEFTGDSDVSGMEFTLRDRTGVDFCSPVKSMETKKLEQELSKIQEKMHNSPEFTQIDNDKEDLRRKVSEQEDELAQLKEQLLELKHELRRSRLPSSHKHSIISSPQYELWSSRSKALTPERLQESDLRGDSSKNSNRTANTKHSEPEFVEFRLPDKAIMEQPSLEQQQQEPWDRIELIENSDLQG